MDFEWDEAKRLANIAKHRLDFADAPFVFDEGTLQAPATAKGDEARVMVTGVLEARYVTMICTFRGDVCRIISFRRARDGEKSDTRRYTEDELRAMRARGESRTDFAALDAKTAEELEADIAGDPDFRDVPANWHEAAAAVMPANKKLLSLRLDADVVDWFRSQGPGYQTRINAVLKAFVSHEANGKKRA